MLGYEQLAERHIREDQLRQQALKESLRRDATERRGRHSGAAIGVPDWQRQVISQAGPMCILDVVALDLEAFVELCEHAPRCHCKADVVAYGSPALA